MPNEPLACAITGANGYVGSLIANRLRAQGLSVVEFNRRASADPTSPPAISYSLDHEVPADAFTGVGVLIHCAYDFKPIRWKEIKWANVDGSLRLFASAHAAGVPRLIFISTISAFEGCRSKYGRAKLMVEKQGAPYGVIAVRPGLVYDDHEPKGMVGALAKLINRSPIIPLIGSGKQVLYPCHADDLAELVLRLCTQPLQPQKPVTAASKQGLSFKQILQRLAAARHKKALFVPVPYVLVLAMLRLAELCGLRIRLRSDSLVSLVNQNPQVDFSELDATGVMFRAYSPK